MTTPALRKAFEDQAAVCAEMGSPFSGGVLGQVAGALDDPAFAALTQPWVQAPHAQIVADAVPLRLLGGLHDLVLSGEEPALAAEYPAASPDPDPARLGPLLSAAAREHQERLARFMRSPPQTNEVGRSFCLFGGFLTVAAETGLPLRCLELGASAGLNQIWDLYRYELGQGRGWGDPAAPLVLAALWEGEAPPLHVPVSVAERRACDQAPVDLQDRQAVRRLEAYVWADQTERLARLRNAVAMARTAGVRVEAADAADWALRNAMPQPGAATVLYHSVFWQYPSAETRAGLAATIAAAAAAATEEAPFAWLRLEPDADYHYEVRLSRWPGGEDRRLALAHPHGAVVKWG